MFNSYLMKQILFFVTTTLLIHYNVAFTLNHGNIPKISNNNAQSHPYGPRARLRNLEHRMVTTDSLMTLAADIQAPILTLTRETAEKVAAPFFGASLFPYLVFIYFLNFKGNQTPKGVTVGFASLLSFVFLTIPAAIIAESDFGVSLADCDWLHGSAESLLTITNLVTVIAFRQALNAKTEGGDMPKSAESYFPMTYLVVGLTLLAGVTAVWPALTGAQVHTPYLNGFLDLPKDWVVWGQEPPNALSIGW